jgi:hypothetical protein
MISMGLYLLSMKGLPKKLGDIYSNEPHVGECGGSLVKSTGRHQIENAVVPNSNPAPLTVSWTGPGNMTVYYKNKSQGGRRPCPSK